jgi:hypothetical protein
MTCRDLRFVSVLTLASIVLTLAGCAGGQKAAQVSLFPEYVLANSAEQTQAKSAVTISVTPLGPSGMYEHPELFAFKKDELPDPIGGEPSFLTYYKKDYQGQYWCYTFGAADQDLAVFSVEIENGTDHILRMKDARIYLEVEGHDPVAAVTKLGDPTLVPATNPALKVIPKSAADGDESLIHWVTYWEQEAEKTRSKHTLMDGLYKIPIGLRSQVILQNRPAYKLIADVGAEILPGKSMHGILLFPVTASFDTATLSFYDISTKTDAAGNPTERQTFTFPVKLDRIQMQFDDKQEKRWKTVSAGTAS